jgi:hypothetical protein
MFIAQVSLLLVSQVHAAHSWPVGMEASLPGPSPFLVSSEAPMSSEAPTHPTSTWQAITGSQGTQHHSHLEPQVCFNHSCDLKTSSMGAALQD